MYVLFVYKCRLFIHIMSTCIRRLFIKEFFMYSLLFSTSKYFQNFLLIKKRNLRKKFLEELARKLRSPLDPGTLWLYQKCGLLGLKASFILANFNSDSLSVSP